MKSFRGDQEMKLTKETLKQIIKEELEAVMSEALGGKQGLIKYIMDVNADERSKQEAIELINQLDVDDEYAEDLAQELSQSVPDEWLSSWINYAQREVDFLAPEPSDKPKRKPSRRKTRRTNAALFEGE
jgi:hypothetical protein